MISDITDLLSMLETADAHVRTRVSLYLDFDSLLEVDAKSQHRARLILADLNFPGLLDAPPLSGPVAVSSAAPQPLSVDFSETPVQDVNEEEPITDHDEPEFIGVVEDFVEEAHDRLELPEEPTQTELEPISEEFVFEELDLEELDVDNLDFEEVAAENSEEVLLNTAVDTSGSIGVRSSNEDDSDSATVVDEPLPDLDLSVLGSLGDPDETEDLLREPELGFGSAVEPTFSPDDDEEDLISEPRGLADIEIDEPGEDALITIEDTSDPRSDLEGLSRLGDSDLDDDPDTGNDEVIVRTTEPEELESLELISDSDFSPDDEETFVADLADIEKMKAKMAAMEDTSDGPSEDEVMLPPAEKPAPRVGGPRVAGVGVAGVAAAGVAGVRAGGSGPQVTAGLYGNPSVPQIRDRNAPKPRAAAIQIDAALEGVSAGRDGGSILEEEEVLALGSEEDYGEEVVESRGPGGLSLDVQEYEEEYEEEEEEDDIELEEVEPEPVFDDSVDLAEVTRLISEAEKAVEEGELEMAIDLYSDVLDNDPENDMAHVRRGRLYLDYGDYSRAMSDFMIAEEIAPENPEPQIAVGDLYFARKDYSRAIGHFDDALKMDPNNAMAFCRRGISHYYRKHFSVALADLKQAQKLDDDIPNIRTYIAMAKKKAKR